MRAYAHTEGKKKQEKKEKQRSTAKDYETNDLMNELNFVSQNRNRWTMTDGFLDLDSMNLTTVFQTSDFRNLFTQDCRKSMKIHLTSLRSCHGERSKKKREREKE